MRRRSSGPCETASSGGTQLKNPCPWVYPEHTGKSFEELRQLQEFGKLAHPTSHPRLCSRSHHATDLSCRRSRCPNDAVIGCKHGYWCKTHHEQHTRYISSRSTDPSSVADTTSSIVSACCAMISQHHHNVRHAQTGITSAIVSVTDRFVFFFFSLLTTHTSGLIFCPKISDIKNSTHRKTEICYVGSQSQVQFAQKTDQQRLEILRYVVGPPNGTCEQLQAMRAIIEDSDTTTRQLLDYFQLREVVGMWVDDWAAFSPHVLVEDVAKLLAQLPSVRLVRAVVEVCDVMRTVLCCMMCGAVECSVLRDVQGMVRGMVR